MGRSAPELKFDPPYDRVFCGLPTFKKFADAEGTIRRLEHLRESYSNSRDKKGLSYCRQVALEARRRADLISRNLRVAAEKRLHKKEIALWFQVWLETPEIFPCWLSLRKMTAEYQGLLISEGVDADTLGRPPARKKH